MKLLLDDGNEHIPAIAEEDAIVKHAFRILMQTYWSRSADDTFPSTQLGRDFAALEKGLHGLETGKSLSQEAIETLNRDIDLVDRNWRNCVQRARSLLAETQAAASGFRPPTDDDGPDRKRAGEELGQIHGRISALGDMVRYMALLETHHEISKRLEGA